MLEKLRLDVNNIRGPGFDNWSNMKSKQQDVQKRLLDLNSKAFYTPCGCHSSNLVIFDMANSCSKAVSFSDVVQCVNILFSSSKKLWNILLHHVPSL